MAIWRCNGSGHPGKVTPSVEMPRTYMEREVSPGSRVWKGLQQTRSPLWESGGLEMSGKMEQRQGGVQGSVVKFLSALGEPEGGGARKDPIETHLQVGSSESTLCPQGNRE